MITPEEYPEWYKNLNLSDKQTQEILTMLENMIALNDPRNKPTDEGYFAGKAMGLNSAFRLINGTLHYHDEFGKE